MKPSFLLFSALLTLLIGGCGQDIPSGIEVQATTAAAQQAASGNAYAAYKQEIANLSAAGITTEDCGRFKIVKFDSISYSTTQSNLTQRIQADSSLSSGQKTDLLNQAKSFDYTNQQRAETKSKDDIRAYIKAYGTNALQDSDLQHAVTKVWGVEALTELMKADNRTIGIAVDQYLN